AQELPVATATGERGWNGSPTFARGAVGPGKSNVAPLGLVLLVNSQCAAIELHRNLFQARRAGTRTAGGGSHR
ncbi:MAG: hypothetical protein ACK56R_00210, partial [Pirellulaceae bacterium]